MVVVTAYICYLYPGFLILAVICLAGRLSLLFFEGLSRDFVLIYRSFIDHNVVRTDTQPFALLISKHAFSLFCCRLQQYNHLPLPQFCDPT